MEAFNAVRSCLKSGDDWKISFRDLQERMYTGLWKSLLRIEHVDEALFAAERGRVQTLSDNLFIQYNLPASLSAALIDLKETMSHLFTKRSSPTLFLAIDGLTINIWFLSRGKKVIFRKGRLEGNRTEKDLVRALLQSCLEKAGIEVRVTCEVRAFGELTCDCRSSREVYEGVKKTFQCSKNHFKAFCDGIIGPVVDMLRPRDNELVIVYDGALCFTPWPADVKSIRIRTVPSLTSYQSILSVPEGHHNEAGELLVKNPCLKELNRVWHNLPCAFAKNDVELIASILTTRPLIGRQTTKAEVMKRMSSVGLIHIAADGNKLTGEIALSSNPEWTSQFPGKEDYSLKMCDVQAANLRGSLVVLSCFLSGQGRILKGEGVVGIARPFLAAGALSVLVTLWKIDDEATMLIMKSFYQHLRKGKRPVLLVTSR